MLCTNCHTSDMIPPPSGHIAYLQCPNCLAIQLLYEPQDHIEGYQFDLHNREYRLNEEGEPEPQIIGVFGGYGSAKSRATLQEMLMLCLENPGGTGLMCAPTLQQLKRTTLKTWFNEVCPPPLIKNYNKTDNEILMQNGFVWYVIPTDDEEKLRSINAGLVHMEEASGIKRSIYDQLLTRMRDPFTKIKTMMVCSNPDMGWIKEVLVDNPDRAPDWHPEHADYNPFISVYVWPTDWNQHLPSDFIAMNSRGKPEWWIKRYLKGSFSSIEGAVYPNFVNTLRSRDEYLNERFPDRNVTELPRTWEKFVTLDHGLRNPTAVYFNAIDPESGTVVTYDEYYVSGQVVPVHATTLKPKIEAIPSGRLRFMVGDPSIRNKSDPVHGKSVQALYAEYELFFTPGNNNIEAGILRVNSYIERGKWIIFRDMCPNLVKEGIKYKFPEISMDDDKNPDEKPVKRDDHGMDSTRYGFMMLPDDPALLVAAAYEPPKKYGRVYVKDVEDDDDYEGERDWLDYV